MSELLYAEYINYWKSSQTSPDIWMEKAKKIIQEKGGVISGSAIVDSDGRTAFMMAFTFGNDKFRMVWPMLQPYANTPANQRAARIQAATLLYHDVKAKALNAQVFGFRAAFFQYEMLPDGRSMVDLAAPEIMSTIPLMLRSG